MLLEVVGLGISLAGWLGGVRAHLGAQREAIAALPPSWRDHPELRDDYAQVTRLRVRDLTESKTDLWVWLGCLALFFGLLTAADVPFWLQLSAWVSIALYAAYADRTQSERFASLFAQQHGLDPSPLTGRRALWARHVTTLAISWLGFVGSACFAARLAVEAI